MYLTVGLKTNREQSQPLKLTLVGERESESPRSLTSFNHPAWSVMTSSPFFFNYSPLKWKWILKVVILVYVDVECGRAVEIMKQQGYDQLPVVDKDGRIMGVVTEGNLLAKLASGKVHASDLVSQV